MKILVTGGAGFIGSFLARQLLWRGDDVVIIDNFDEYYPKKCKEFNLDLIKLSINQNPQFFSLTEIIPVAKQLFSYYPEYKKEKKGSFSFIKYDICDEKRLKEIFSNNQFDAIIHLAAMAGVPFSAQKPQLYTTVNVGGTVNLLNLAIQNNVKKFIFASSSSAYGNREDGKVTEDEVVMPHSIYGATKVAGEKMCYAYFKSFGINISIVRIFGPIYGPLQRPYGMLAQRAINYSYNEKILSIYGRNGLETAKDNTYIDDEVKGIILCLDNCNEFEIFNIGTSQPISIKNLIDTISMFSSKKVNFKIVDSKNSDVMAIADITKAKNKLNYTPDINFQEGIKRQIEIFSLMPNWYKTIDNA